VDEKTFINEAIKRGLVTFDQIQECLKGQEAMIREGLEAKIWHVIVAKQMATQEQVNAVLKGQPVSKSLAFGPFAILSKLGEGGMGAVYRAKKQGSEEIVALKVLPDRFNDGDMVKRFEREAKIAITLSHPNLVKGFEFGQVGSRWYYSMELVTGKVVGDFLKDGKRLDEKTALRIIVQVAGALHMIHQHGLVHRDVKPENVIIDNSGVAKLMDLGLVKTSNEGGTALTQTGFAVGTLHYMPPEQFEGKDVDIRSDLYSLGASLYHMVTGTKPFSATTPMEILKQQLQNELDDPRQICPELTDGICHVMEKAMARDREERYRTPTEMMEDLYLVLDGKPPKSLRLSAGHSVMKRRKTFLREGAAPAAPARPTRRFTADPKPAAPQPKKSNQWIVWAAAGGVVGALALVVVIAAASPGSKPVRPPPERPDPPPVRPEDPSTAAQKRIRGLIEARSYNDAARALRSDASLLGARAAELQALLDRAVQRVWEETQRSAQLSADRGDFALAIKEIEHFYSEVREIAGLASKIEAELFSFRDAQLRRDAGRRFRELEEAIREFEAAKAYEQAIGVLEGARTSAGDNPHLLQAIDARLKSLRDLVSAANPDDLFRSAIEHYRQARFNDAIQDLTAILQRSPKDLRALTFRAQCHLRNGNRGLARADLDEASKIDVKHPDVQFAMGLYMLYEKQWTEAVQAFSYAINKDPKFFEAFVGRAEALLELGNYAEAQSDLAEAERQYPRYSESPRFRQLKARAASRTVEPARASPEEIQRKLEGLFHAGSSMVKMHSDGRYRIDLVYDFAREDALSDFKTHGGSIENNALVLAGSEKEPAGLLFSIPLKGDFQIRVEAEFPRPATDSTLMVWVTDADGLSPAGNGAGLGFSRAKGSHAWLQKLGNSPRNLTQEKRVSLSAAARASLSLRREGEKLVGNVANISLEAGPEAPSVCRPRVTATERTRVVKLEIHGTLDEDWVEQWSGGLPSSGEALWNGKDLEGWDGAGFLPREGAIFADVPTKSAWLTHPKMASVKGSSFEATIVVEDHEAGPILAFGIVLTEKLRSDGNYVAGFTDDVLFIARIEEGKLKSLGEAKIDAKPGRGEWVLELTWKDGGLCFRVRGVGELVLDRVFKPEVMFRPGIYVQHARVRVTRFIKK
jgi:serine/threonine-protein kinase